jgi:hypothetical protein
MHHKSLNNRVEMFFLLSCVSFQVKIIGWCKRNTDSLRNIQVFIIAEFVSRCCIDCTAFSAKRSDLSIFFYDFCKDLVHSDRNVSKHEKCLDRWFRVLVEVSFYGQISIESKIN